MYSLLLLLLLPVFYCYRAVRLLGLLRVGYDSRSSPNQGQSGKYTGKYIRNYDLWIHSASVGEVNLAMTLADELLSLFPQPPQLSIVFTTNTVTGLTHARRLITELTDKYKNNNFATSYAPYDLPLFINRFLSRFNPRSLILLEAELWRNWSIVCSKKHIPIVLANGRLSAKSLHRGHKLSFSLPPPACLPRLIAAQSKADADNFVALYKSLGVKSAEINKLVQIKVCGNIKFDALTISKLEQPSPKVSPAVVILQQQLPTLNSCIWCGGSTHQPEEELLLEAQRHIKTPNLLILAPRHPHRFKQVVKILEQRQAQGELRYIRLSQLNSSSNDNSNKLGYKLDKDQVILVDTMGDLANIYPLVSFAFIGGSFTKRGGQNILEPLAHGVPVILGPHHHNLASILRYFNQQNKQGEQSIAVVQDGKQLTNKIVSYATAPDLRQLATKAREVIVAQRGAARQNASLIINNLANHIN